MWRAKRPQQDDIDEVAGHDGEADDPVVENVPWRVCGDLLRPVGRRAAQVLVAAPAAADSSRSLGFLLNSPRFSPSPSFPPRSMERKVWFEFREPELALLRTVDSGISASPTLRSWYRRGHKIPSWMEIWATSETLNVARRERECLRCFRGRCWNG